jgi:hypothetical protein
MTRTLALCLVLAIVAAVAADTPLGPPAVGQAATATVELVDGAGFSGVLDAISGGRAVFRTGGQRRQVALRDLASICISDPPDPMQKLGQAVVVLASGGVLAAEELSAADGQVRLVTSLTGRLAVEMSAVSVIYMPGPAETAGQLARTFREIRHAPSSQDYIVALDDKGRWIPALGALGGIDSEGVAFRFDEVDRRVNISSVRVIQLARVPRDVADPIGAVAGMDGSVLPFADVGLDKGKLTVAADGVTCGPVSMAEVGEIRLRSDRSVWLDELTPSEVVQAGMFDVAFPYRKNRSAAGGPIRLGGRTYERGLGMHSRCELTYSLEGAYVAFAARVGIDKLGGKRGIALLKLLGDGKELIDPLTLRGDAAPVNVRCSLAAVKTLRIVVDFGPDGTDVGDHVDLADARLIKP